MPGTGIVQQAFKSALLGGTSNLDNVVDLTLEASAFERRFNALLPNDNLSNAALIAGAGVATVAAIAGAYLLIKNRIDCVDDERESFIDSVNANVVSFFVFNSKDKRRDSVKYVAGVITELERNPILNKFSRLLIKTIDKDGKNGKHYNAFSIASLPFGVHFDQPREDGDNVDEAIQAINFFLGGEFLELLDTVKREINHSLLNDTKLFFNAQSHIQDLNATRLIAIILANIAINLIQGINPNNSLPLTTDESYKLCEEFRSLLLKLKLGINSELSQFKDKLVAAHKLELFIDRLEERINYLQISYKDKLKNDLNLNDVINGGYAVIQNTTRPIRRLLYRNERLENMAAFFSRLIDLNIEIKNKPEIFQRLIKKLDMKPNSNFAEMGLNSEPSTAMDFLAIYVSHYRDVRKNALKRFSHPSDVDFVETLKYIDENYVQYIENLTESYGFLGRHKNPINPARVYLICFIALMLEAHNVTLLDKKPGFLSSNEQALQFLRRSLENNAYYGWQYLLSGDVSSHLRDYLQKQIHLVIAIRHLSLITTLTEINSGYLQRQDFQAFVKEKLEKLQKIHSEFIDAKDRLVEAAAQNAQQPFSRLIISEINHDVPDKFTNLRDLCANFNEDLDRAMQQISSPEFKARLKLKETELIDKIETYDPELGSAEFYANLQNSAQMQILKADIAKRHEVKGEFDRSLDKASTWANGANSNFASFKLKVLNAICIASSALLLIGLVILVSMTYGVNALAVLSDLASGVQSALMITGFVSAAAGGVGLATSYFAPRFFNKRSDLIPVKEDFSLEQPVQLK